MVRILFLDIDGVLTSARCHVALSPRQLQGLIWHKFDPVAIGFLNRLVERYPDLKFVLSSTWRRIFDQRTMTMFMSQAGWLGEWHQNWRTGDGKNRGEEVDAWVKEHKPESYVILDDIKDNNWFPDQLTRFVQTDMQDGMNSIEHYYKCEEILKHKIKKYEDCI